MSRKLTEAAVIEARAFIAAAASFKQTLTRLEEADRIEAEELLGCTLIKVARIFDKPGE